LREKRNCATIAILNNLSGRTIKEIGIARVAG
jgi:hypothetical protein